MSPHTLRATLLLGAALAAAGVLLGRCYFRMLRFAVERYASGRSSAPQAAVLALGRILCATALFAAAARLGALPLLAAFAGFLVARTAALRAARKAS